MVPLFVPMFMLVQMAVPRVLESSLSSPLMMLAMLFNSSMVMTGKVARSRFVKTALLVQDPVLAVVVDLVDAEALAEALALEADLVRPAEAVATEDLAEVVAAASGVATEVVDSMEELAPFPLPQILSPISLLQVPREAILSMSGTLVLLLRSIFDHGEANYFNQLPWSTSNEDLVELFTTIGKVEQAEIQYEPNGRSRGTGVVRFDTIENAETAIEKFSGYQYGGPLGLSFVKYQTPGGGGDAMETEATSLTQDQIM
jgi:hypothetical protein